MKKGLKLLSVLTVLALASCGTGGTSSSKAPSSNISDLSSEPAPSSEEPAPSTSESVSSASSASSENKPSSSSENKPSSSSSSEAPSSPSSSSSSEAPAKDEFLESLDTAEKFAAAYSDLISATANKITYTTAGQSSYDSFGTYKLIADKDEVLINFVSEDNTDVTNTYTSIQGDVFYSVSVGTSFSSVQRAKIVEEEQDGAPRDYMSKDEAEENMGYAKEDFSVKGIIGTYSFGLTSIPTTTEGKWVKSYDAYKNNDGSYTIEAKIYQENYTSIIFSLELNFSKDKQISSVFAKKDLYYSDSWDKENHAPAAGKNPSSTQSITISELVYTEVADTKLFDPTPYFLTSCSSPSFGYMDWSTWKYVTTLSVGDEFLPDGSFSFDDVEVVPETACDESSLYVTGISDESFFTVEVDDWGDVNYTAAKAGTVTFYFGNAFVSNACSCEVTITEGSGGQSGKTINFSGEVDSDYINCEEGDFSNFDYDTMTGVVSYELFVIPGDSNAVVAIGLAESHNNLSSDDFIIDVAENTIGAEAYFLWSTGLYIQIGYSCSESAEEGTASFTVTPANNDAITLQFNLTVYSMSYED